MAWSMFVLVGDHSFVYREATGIRRAPSRGGSWQKQMFSVRNMFFWRKKVLLGRSGGGAAVGRDAMHGLLLEMSGSFGAEVAKTITSIFRMC